MPNYGRRIRWLGIAVLVAIAVYTGAWFYFADVLQKQTVKAIADVQADGTDVDCTRPTVRGYPFRMALFCDGLRYGDRDAGIAVTTGALRTAAQVYDLKRIVGELDGPAAIQVPGAPPLTLSWASLRGSVRLADPLPQRVSVEGRDAVLALASGAPLGRAADVQAHLRPNGGDLDLAGSFEALTLDPAAIGGRTLPPVSATSDLTVTNGVALVETGAESLRGSAGTIRSVSLSAGGAEVSLSGPFSVGTDGLLDADLAVSLKNPQALGQVLAAAFPEAGGQIASALSAVSFLGGASPTLPLRIVDGRASLGPIPLGRVPPL